MNSTVFDRTELDRLLAQVDLVSLIEQRSPTRFGKAAGRDATVKGSCPFADCGGTDRFAVFVNDTPQHYKCGIHGNGCGKHGDALTFLREYEHLSFREAIALLSGDESPVLSFPTQASGSAIPQWQTDQWQKKAAQFVTDAGVRLGSDAGELVLTYARSRGLYDETIKKSHLGMVMYKGANIAKDEPEPVPCLVIPWFDVKSNRYWRVTLRDIRPGIDSKRRYENLPGSSNFDGLYGAESLQFNRPVFLVEGEMDALTIAQCAGDIVSVCATGSTSGGRSTTWAMRLANMPYVFVAFDAELKAEESASWWLKALSKNAMRWKTPIGKDANSLLMSGGNVRLWVQSALSLISGEEEASAAMAEFMAIELPATVEMQWMIVSQPPMRCRECGNGKPELFQIYQPRGCWQCRVCHWLAPWWPVIHDRVPIAS